MGSDIYRGAMVTDEYGVEKDISVLLSGQARSAASDLITVETEDVEEFYMRNDVPSLQGGQLSWKEMSVEGMEETQETKDHHHRQRDGDPHPHHHHHHRVSHHHR